METINLVVRKRNLRFKSGSPKTVIAWNTGYIINFDFDEDWEDLKTIKIVNDKGDTISDTLFSGNSVEIPKIYNTGYIGIGVYAGDLKSTTPLIISCQKSILDYDGSPIPPPDDVYNKIMDLLNGIYNGEAGSGGTSKTPYIGANGNWYEWDANMLEYVDTGVSAKGKDGANGANGEDGFSPVITENADNTDDVYRLDITSETESYTTPNLIGKQGVKGEKGEQGVQGIRGERGLQGEKGIDGEKGDAGDDGVSVTSVEINSENHLIVTLSNNTTVDAGLIKTIAGEDGSDGYTPQKGVDYYTEAEKTELVNEITTEVTGDIGTALDSIIAIQNELMGVSE